MKHSRAFLCLITACSVGLFRLGAQSSGLPFPADIRLTEVRLPTPNLSVSVRYALVDRGLTYFSPIFVERADIGGQPLVAADGTLRIPPGSRHLLTLTFRDPEKGPGGRVELRNALAAAPDVLQESGGIPPQPINSALVSTERKVSLILRDPEQGNRPVALTGESRLADQEGNPTPQVDFVLESEALNTLRRARASDIEIAFFQDYPARFETNNVVITVENLQRQVGNLRQSLAPIPDGAPGAGGAAGIVLDAAFGSAITQNGTLDKSTLISDFIRRNVSFNVRYRSGASLDTPLVERLVDFALNRASDFLQKSPFEGSNTFVTLLLRDDIQITTTLGRLDEFATQMETGRTEELFNALIESSQQSQSVNVDVRASVYGFGSGRGRVAVNLSESAYREALRHEFLQSFRNAAAWYRGSIPYLPGIRFSTTLGVDNIRWEDFRSALTEFTTGNITLYRAFNLASLANRQEGITIFAMFSELVEQNEQLLRSLTVPQVEVGEYVAPNHAAESANDWKENSPDEFTHEVVVRFSKPFDAPPRIAVALSKIESVQTEDRFEKLNIKLSASDITATQFTLRLRVANGGNRNSTLRPPKWLLAATWVATGQGRQPVNTSNIYREFLNKVPNHQVPTTAEQQFAVTPWISPAILPDAGNQFTVRFSTVPLRAYQIESSPDLHQWFSVGSVTAGQGDLNSLFRFTPDSQYQHLFFRVTAL